MAANKTDGHVHAQGIARRGYSTDQIVMSFSPPVVHVGCLGSKAPQDPPSYALHACGLSCVVYFE